MKVKCGVDIIEVSRIEEAIENLEDKFLNRVYTKKEIEYCNSKNNMKYQHFAVRFAAKEAIFKAVSESLEEKTDIVWTNIEILNNKDGRPYVSFINCDMEEKIENIDISLSHIKEYAIANCVVTFK